MRLSPKSEMPARGKGGRLLFERAKGHVQISCSNRPASSVNPITRYFLVQPGQQLVLVQVVGVATVAQVLPLLGMPLAIGGCIGRVVRIFSTGFAVKFVATYRAADLARLISRDSAPGRQLQRDIAEPA